MWNVANCSPSVSSGEISATNSSAMPVPHSTARPTGAARGPPWRRDVRQRTPYTAPYAMSDAMTTGAKFHDVSTGTSVDCDALGTNTSCSVTSARRGCVGDLVRARRVDRPARLCGVPRAVGARVVAAVWELRAGAAVAASAGLRALWAPV